MLAMLLHGAVIVDVCSGTRAQMEISPREGAGSVHAQTDRQTDRHRDIDIEIYRDIDIET